MGRPTITPADALRVMGPSPTLSSAERGLCVLALERAGTIVDAAKLLGTNRHVLKRLMTKHRIVWPTPDGPLLEVVQGG